MMSDKEATSVLGSEAVTKAHFARAFSSSHLDLLNVKGSS